MIVVAFDTETALIRPGKQAPELACVTWQMPDEEPQIIHGRDPATFRLLRGWLEDPNVLITAHNTQYDVAATSAQYPDLLPLWFAAYDADRVTCTKWRQVLLDLACGSYRWSTKDDGTRIRIGYDLDTCLWRYCHRRLDKDTWRLRYGEFLDVPLAAWPEGARTYPLEDARAHREVYFGQEDFNNAAIAGAGLDLLKSQFHEARSYLGLYLTQCWGLRTDGAKVDMLAAQVLEEIDKVKWRLVEAGFIRTDKKSTRNMNAVKAHMIAVCHAQGIPVPRTKPTAAAPDGNICLDGDACEQTGDDLLADYSRYTTLLALLSKDVKLLKKGTRWPVHPNFGFAESGRTTASPNTQNFARSNG